MIAKSSLFALAGCAAAFVALPANAWNIPIGTVSSTCTDTYTTGAGSVLFTLDTTVYSPVSTGGDYIYEFNLVNNSDVNALTSLSLNTGTTGTSYFIGFGPIDNNVLHDSSIGSTLSPSTVKDNQTTGGTPTWEASSNSGTVSFTALTNGVNDGDSLSGEYQKTFSYNGSQTAGDEFFLESTSLLSIPDATVEDSAGDSYSVMTCLGTHGVTPAPEPGTLVPFAFGALGLLGLAARRRRVQPSA